MVKDNVHSRCSSAGAFRSGRDGQGFRFMRLMLVLVEITAARFCSAPSRGEYSRDATSRNRKKQWDADFSADQQNGACQGDGGDAEFQDQRGGDDEQRSAELGNDMAVFRIVNFPVQSLQIRLLRAAGLSDPGGFRCIPVPLLPVRHLPLPISG